jgi:hypothetical protein
MRKTRYMKKGRFGKEVMKCEGIKVTAPTVPSSPSFTAISRISASSACPDFALWYQILLLFP